MVWGNFYGLTQVPRPSKHEGKVIEYLLNWGKEHGVEVRKDETGNVIFRVPATPGYENRRGVILQGHMDMVPQKTSDSSHNFLTDPIKAYVDGDWVTADRTTLGADNGMGVAMGLADEETGMTGATALKPGVLKGDILINLDSEDEGELCVGCAGGLDVSAEFKYRKYPVRPGWKGLKLTVKGLKGGHSGMDISLYRANANKVMARILLPLMEVFGVQVVSFTGGSLRNAIPFEATVETVVPAENLESVKKLIGNIFDEIQAEFKDSDPGAVLYVDDVPAAPKFIQGRVMLNAVKAILACPSSVTRMSQTMEGLTETSVNLAIVRTEKGRITVHSLMRSAVDTAKAALAQRIRCIFELAGADEIEFKGGYSGWRPKLDTPMNKVMMEQFQKVYGRPMKIMATHGGLPHSPDERVNIASVGRTWEYLKEVLKNVPEK